MVNLAQRIETLRTARSISRPALAKELGFPRTALEKFETGRQTPTQDQLKKLADYFGLTVHELKEGEGDMSAWMDGAFLDEPKAAALQPGPRLKPAQTSNDGGNGSMMDALLTSSKFREAMQEAALEALRTPEGQELLANIVRKELMKHGR